MSIEKHSLTSVVFTDEGNTGKWQPSLGDGYMGAHHDRSTLLEMSIIKIWGDFKMCMSSTWSNGITVLMFL